MFVIYLLGARGCSEILLLDGCSRSYYSGDVLMAEPLFPISEMCPDDMVSVEAFLENTPEFLAKYSELSIVAMEINYKHFSDFIKGLGITLGKVDQKTIIAYQQYVNAQGASANTYAQKMSHIRTLLNYIGKRFVYRVRKRTAYGNIKVIDEGDFIKVLNYIEKLMGNKNHRYHIKYLRDYILFKLLYITGLRKSEALSLRHEDVFEEAGIYVYQVTVKGGNSVKKEFPKSLIPLVRELRSIEKKTSHHPIFTGQANFSGSIDSSLFPNKVNTNLNQYYKKAVGKPGTITVHGIRNVSGYAVQMSTNDVYNTKDHLNHKSIHTTVDYLEQIKKRTRTPIEDLERRLESK